jgi:P27 family predicted phage terminase small subunit
MIEVESLLVPKAPAGLKPAEKAFWRKLAPQATALGRLNPSDVTLFRQLCATLATIQECEAVIGIEGLTATTASGSPRTHPAVRTLENARRLAARMLAEFGLSPSSRQRIEDDRERRRVFGA